MVESDRNLDQSDRWGNRPLSNQPVMYSIDQRITDQKSGQAENFDSKKNFGPSPVQKSGPEMRTLSVTEISYPKYSNSPY